VVGANRSGQVRPKLAPNENRLGRNENSQGHIIPEIELPGLNSCHYRTRAAWNHASRSGGLDKTRQDKHLGIRPLKNKTTGCAPAAARRDPDGRNTPRPRETLGKHAISFAEKNRPTCAWAQPHAHSANPGRWNSVNQPSFSPKSARPQLLDGTLGRSNLPSFHLARAPWCPTGRQSPPAPPRSRISSLAAGVPNLNSFQGEGLRDQGDHEEDRNMGQLQRLFVRPGPWFVRPCFEEPTVISFEERPACATARFGERP